MQVRLARILVNWILVGVACKRSYLLGRRLVVDSWEVADVVAASGKVCFWIDRLVSEVSVFTLAWSGGMI